MGLEASGSWGAAVLRISVPYVSIVVEVGAGCGEEGSVGYLGGLVGERGGPEKV